ncbi:TRAP transporter substrate-binding protein [Desulfotalea psychrophila]|uniref:Probable DctP (Periplasmic C4-dicarboxylate binding protein) n=1 Tax=Desulfotalea psychrophila (strain LSv54 / DSM 12343) TaxID=177439 RepID=Q6ANI6_DESPS|nr:TRAP transporter substrate-binding protein [Desulfotalea psychrophila]CAG36088.1 probable DctP (periplasmic C4-dicarboxylate binding protein) [Desulfotalea psychrophila LSv54]
MKHFSRKCISTIGGIALSASLATSALATSWDMPTPYPDATFHTQNIALFAEDVKKATDGKLVIKLHTAGSLFKHPEIKNAVRGGQVPIGEFFMSLLGNENPIFAADSQPFLATNYDDAKKLWNAQKPIVAKLLDKQGLMPLFSVAWPPQGLYTQKAINRVGDIKGIKFRTYNATSEKLANKLGAAPTQVEVPDIPQAFSTGRVAAMITSPSTGANSKAWDFVEDFTDIQAWLPKNIVVINKRAFRRLDKETQTALLQAGAKAELRGWEMSKKETETKIQVMKDNGMNIIQPSPELMSGFKVIGNEIVTEWEKEAGPAGTELLSTYRK